MAFARVVSFDGVDNARIEELARQIREDGAPEGFPSAELVILHDAGAQRALAVVFFETEDDFRRGDEILSAMPAGDTPGQRTSVTRYDVAARMKS